MNLIQPAECFLNAVSRRDYALKVDAEFSDAETVLGLARAQWEMQAAQRELMAALHEAKQHTGYPMEVST